MLGRPRRHDEPVGDLRVRQPLGDEREHLELARRSARPGSHGSPRAARAERGARARAAGPPHAASAARLRARVRSRSPRAGAPRRRAARACSARSYIQPTSPNASAAPLQSRRSIAACAAEARRGELDRDSGDGRRGRDADRAPPDQAARRPRSRPAAPRAARPASARPWSGPTRSPARRAAPGAGAHSRERPAPRGRPAARRHPHRRGGQRAR